MKSSRFLAILTISLSALVAFGCSRRTDDHRAVQSRSRIPLRTCNHENAAADALCGNYEVYEDRTTKTGRKISLNIIVLPAQTANPTPDPVFWLVGGPGDAATRDANSSPSTLFHEIGKNRDVIFVDQRGTGSSNPLNCDLGDDPANLASFFGELFPIEKVRACRQQLEKVANLALYTTPIAMDDLDEVREALGYGKINLAGSSYGTIAAQVYMRKHPDHVRAVFLAGVASPAIRQPLLFARAAQNALDFLFVDCAADRICNTAFPNFKSEFDAVIARFDKGPVNAELKDPQTGTKQTVQITRESFVEHLRLLLYAPYSARYVPIMIHHASQNDFLPFVSLAISFNVGPSLARGMYLTVTCSEGVPFITESLLTQESKGTFVGQQRVRSHMEACKEWPHGKIAPEFIDLVNSAAPVLMISGEVDGATPPWFGEDAVKHFPNGRQVKFRYMGHGANNACVRSLFTDFIKSGSSAGLDASCTATVRRPAFVTADFALYAMP
jgi:pimeloyl-ACP methyl ester carboxylesterase